jgi:hypothetical protein
VEYNQQFLRPARRAGSAYRKLDCRLDLDYVFSLRYERTVNHDHTIAALPGVTVQLPALSAKKGYAGKKVEVCQQPNGDVRIYLEGRLLLVQPAPENAPPPRAQDMRRRLAPRKKKPVRIYSFAGRPAVAPR